MLSRRLLFVLLGFARGQQQCYYAAGAQYRGPDNLVPCNTTGTSACCLRGDTCLSGNTCYNPNTGNLYQYGCTDISYNDGSCPYKCGFDPDLSPWTALEYCNDVQDLSNTWICHGPESCGCSWKSSYDMLVLAPRGCKAMGSDALVALYAPSKLAPYVSLPLTAGGSTGYYSPTVSGGSSTWIETAIAGYTPSAFTQLTTYRDAPTSSVWVDARATPGPSTYASAKSWTGAAPTPTTTDNGDDDSSDTTTATSSPSESESESSSTTTPQSQAAALSPGLSTGAKAGIGVGVAGGVCLILALLIALYLMNRRHKRERQRETEHQPQVPPPHSPQMQMGIPPYPQSPVHWASFPQPAEPYYAYHPQEQEQVMPARDPSRKRQPTELSADASHTVHEMESVTSGLSPRMSTKSTPTPIPTPVYVAENRIGNAF